VKLRGIRENVFAAKDRLNTYINSQFKMKKVDSNNEVYQKCDQTNQSDENDANDENDDEDQDDEYDEYDEYDDEDQDDEYDEYDEYENKDNQYDEKECETPQNNENTTQPIGTLNNRSTIIPIRFSIAMSGKALSTVHHHWSDKWINNSLLLFRFKSQSWTWFARTQSWTWFARTQSWTSFSRKQSWTSFSRKQSWTRKGI
jgi:hypothetical protein